MLRTRQSDSADMDKSSPCNSRSVLTISLFQNYIPERSFLGIKSLNPPMLFETHKENFSGRAKAPVDGIGSKDH